MKNSIAKTLKIVGWVLMILGIAGAISVGVACELYWLIPVGILFSFITGLLFIGFGELIEKTSEIADNTRSSSAPVQPVKEVEDLPEI